MTVEALVEREGWRVEGDAARVHYRGDGARYSVEYYADPGCVLYWRVPRGDEPAVPTPRTDVPGPLRFRIREDLSAAGIDPGVEQRTV